MSTDELLKIIQKTNPDMTKERMIYELSQCRYASKALIYVEKCCKKFRGNAFNTPLGIAFYIHNFDFDNSQNLVQISFKSCLKKLKNFFGKI